MSYSSDRAYSDGFIPVLRHIIGPHLLEESTLTQDREQAADLVVFTGHAMTIACRVRRQGYADRYPWDFTIRALRDNGAKTELSKVIDGWGDWFLYGHDDGSGVDLARWFLLDLKVFRSTLIRRPSLLRDRNPIPNSDGTHFHAWNVQEFPDHFVIAASTLVPRVVAA